MSEKTFSEVLKDAAAIPPRRARVTVLGEPWCSMTEEQAQNMTADQARQMLQSVKTPKLDELRRELRGLRTSELIGYIAHPGSLDKKLFVDDGPPGDRLDRYTGHDEQLIMGAAVMAVGDEIDNRIPRP